MVHRILLIFIFPYALDIPSNLVLDEVTSSSFKVNFTAANNAIAHQYELTRRHTNVTAVTEYLPSNATANVSEFTLIRNPMHRLYSETLLFVFRF